MVKMNSIDGEYMAVGRQTVETSNVLSPFGGAQQQSVNITGSGIQEIEYQDGFRMSIMASKPMTINTDVVNGVSTSMLNGAAMPVSMYSCCGPKRDIKKANLLFRQLPISGHDQLGRCYD